MKKLKGFIKKITGQKTPPKTIDRKELERRAVEGAEKAVREYRRVFERLAEYDRT